ncbi:unnamed protein product, partial [Mesorhabditis spiculigera]
MSHLNILIRPVLFLLIVAALSHAYSGKAKRSLDIFDGGMGGEMKLLAQPKPTRMPNNARKNGDGTVPHVKLSLDSLDGNGMGAEMH